MRTFSKIYSKAIVKVSIHKQQFDFLPLESSSSSTSSKERFDDSMASLRTEHHFLDGPCTPHFTDFTNHSMSTSPAPPTRSGVERWKYEIIGGFGILSLIYGSAYTLVQRHNGLTFSPAPQYCHDQSDPCSRPDLFAFQVSGFVSQIFLAGNGYMAWHLGTKPGTPHQRLFGYLPSADRLNAGILVYQLWDFVFSLAIPEHATPGVWCNSQFVGSKAHCSHAHHVIRVFLTSCTHCFDSLSRSPLGSCSHGLLFFGVSNVSLLCQLFWRLQ